MPIITFANSKGGAGKTTVALVLAAELVRRGHRVTVLDADPQQWASRWYRLSAEPAGLTVISGLAEETVEKTLKEARKKADYTIIDLAPGLTPMLAKAIGFSDHVMIPVQGCAMDAAGGAQVLEILQGLAAKHEIRIPHSVVLTRISPIITTRTLMAVKTMLSERQVHVLDTALIERAAYRDMFIAGGSLSTLDAGRVSNLDKAQDNASLLADEVLRRVPAKVARPKAARKTSVKAAA